MYKRTDTENIENNSGVNKEAFSNKQNNVNDHCEDVEVPDGSEEEPSEVTEV